MTTTTDTIQVTQMRKAMAAIDVLFAEKDNDSVEALMRIRRYASDRCEQLLHSMIEGLGAQESQQPKGNEFVTNPGTTSTQKET